jgi:hypothetical protein
MDSLEHRRERLGALEQPVCTVSPSPRPWRSLACGLMALGLLSWALPVGTAHGAVGDPVRTVTLPPEIDCRVEGVAGHVAISVAAVPRAALGLTGTGVLLATSCRSAQGSTIYFIDPGPPDRSVSQVAGTVVHTLQTIRAGTPFAPPNGWGAFAFRGEVIPQDMLACSNPASSDVPHDIYTVDLRTGVARRLFGARRAGGEPATTPGLPYCDGLAWDPANDTIYMSPDISDTVYHYDPTGGLIRTLPVPSGCFVADATGIVSGNSGIVVVGPDLLLACNGAPVIYQVRQSDGAVVRSFSSGAERAEDLECDRTTFGPALSVAWTKDAFIPRFLAFEVPAGTCGLCRADPRRDLNSLSPTQQQELAALLEEYLTGEIVDVHRRNNSPWHSMSTGVAGLAFFPGHRGYIGGFEMWLLNVRNRPEFVPLPKWNPATSIPSDFQRTDTTACREAGGVVPECSGIMNSNINTMLPTSFVFAGPPPTTSGLCAYTDIRRLQVGGGGRPSLEHDYHDGVHCAVGGTMCNVFLSPATLVFWPWHAFVDDVGHQYERACLMSTQTCTDVFTPVSASQSMPFRANSPSPSIPPRASGARAGPPAHVTAPLGFWWWFEDVVTPPEVSPAVVVDHSGFNFEGRVRGRAKLVPGLVGQALQLDGRDDFVEVRDRTVGEVGSSDFTLDAWIKTGANGVQSIVDKRNAHGIGYALFLKDGLLGLHLGTDRKQHVFMAEAGSVADGQWHHVAAVISRDEADASGLFIDGEVVAEFDATALAGDATSHARLWIGRSRSLHDDDRDDDRDDRSRSLHDDDHSAFFEGELDEIDLFRSALSRDLVASIYIAGSAGKYGSLGNLPTSAERPPCLVELGEMITGLPEAAPLVPLYEQVIDALRGGNEALARRRLRELSNQAMAMGGEPVTFLNQDLHLIHHQADACLNQRRLQAP